MPAVSWWRRVMAAGIVVAGPARAAEFEAGPSLKAAVAGASDEFGAAVAVSGDTLVVGMPGEAGYAGAARVFTRSGNGWLPQGNLKALKAEAGDRFGTSVAISGDTIVVGASWEDGGAKVVNGTSSEAAPISGAAYVFTRTAGVWSQQAYLKPLNGGTNDFFGTAVAISGDVAVVGANGEDGAATTVNGVDTNTLDGAGAAYVFIRAAGVWSQQAYLKPLNPGATDNFGLCVAIAGDAVVVGADGEDGAAATVNGVVNNGAEDAGAAYVFRAAGGTWAQEAYLKAGNSGTFDNFGGAVAISGDSVIVGAFGEDGGAGGATDNSLLNSGAAYVFRRTAGAWAPQGYLKAPNRGAGDWFGAAVAISGDLAIVGAPQEAGGGAAAGAIYGFTRTGASWSAGTYLKAPAPAADDQAGFAVAADGGRIFAGEPGDDAMAAGSGAVHGFVWTGAPLTLAGWRELYFGSPLNTGAGADGVDADGDGASNLLEYALDGNPKSGAASGKVRIAFAEFSGATHLTLTAPVRKAAVFSGPGDLVSAAIDGVIYSVQGSLALADFTAVEVVALEPALADGLPGLSAGWEYRSFRLGLSRAAAAKGFLRVRVAPGG